MKWLYMKSERLNVQDKLWKYHKCKLRNPRSKKKSKIWETLRRQ